MENVSSNMEGTYEKISITPGEKTHEFYFKFGEEDAEVIGTLYDNNKLTLELNPKENENASFSFNSKDGKRFTLGIRPIVKE
jgi:hypothetical protein